jgi:hypothetical protein
MLGSFFLSHPALVIALIGLAAFVLASLGERKADPMADTIEKAGWESIKEISAILVILGFLILIAQWVYSYLF